MRWLSGGACIALCLFVLQSCSLPFYWQAASGQLSLLRSREPIAEVIADPQTSTELKASLAEVARVRQFAIDELQLPDNGSYQTYADLGRDYVVWNVVAAGEFSIAPQRWCFPFAGCVSYRGFFDRANALAFEAQLKERGLDTWSGGADAYSTLGYFADPVLSTMLDSGPEGIVSVLIHELAHQRLYVKDDSEFNEAFASTIEEYGTRLWFEREGDAAAIARYEARQQARTVFADLITRQRQRLDETYSRTLSDDERRAAKAAAFAMLKEEYAAERDAGRMPAGYDGWFAQDLKQCDARSRRYLPVLGSGAAATPRTPRAGKFLCGCRSARRTRYRDA